jgi:hypothetical protein
MSEYTERFAEERIEIDVLTELTDQDFQRLRVPAWSSPVDASLRKCVVPLYAVQYPDSHLACGVAAR